MIFVGSPPTMPQVADSAKLLRLGTVAYSGSFVGDLQGKGQVKGITHQARHTPNLAQPFRDAKSQNSSFVLSATYDAG